MAIVQKRAVAALVVSVIALIAEGAAAFQRTDAPVLEVPRLPGITVDGNPADWGERGFRVDVLFDPAPRPRPAATFDAAVRLGWDERGLLVLVTVDDDLFVEEEKDDALWRRDSVELFVADSLGGKEVWQAVVAPGMDAKHPELRMHLYDHRRSDELKKVQLAASAARTKAPTGYVLEALLPWENLGIKPTSGREVAFQVVVNDADDGRGTSQLRWFPVPGAQFDTRRMHRLRLAEKPSAPVTASASGDYERFRRTRVNVAATADLAGKTARVRQGRETLGEGELARDGRLARAAVVFPMPPRGKPFGPLSVTIGRRLAATLELPNADAARKQAFERAEMSLKPFVFSGEKLPEPEFEEPSLVEDLIGPYTLKTAYYDADCSEVAAATKPGRYGAIVEIRPQDGPPTKRFLTLFRQPESINWRAVELPSTIELPKQLGIDPAIAREQSETLADYLKWELRTAFNRDSASAILLAGLYETKPGTPPTDRTGPRSRDAWWWHGLKKKTGDLVPLRYLVHLPPGAEADKAKRWPTLLFLHGAGERGDDLKLVEVHGPPKIVKTRKDFPFVVIAPQCPAGTWWNAPLLDDLLKEVAAKYPIDPDRIYLTGLSMGGFGSWTLAMEYPGRFAAVVPICGGGDPRDVERIKDLPVWVFHGAKDGAVPVDFSRKMVDALRKLGGRVRLTVYPDADHDSWTATYANDELYSWLLQQRRGQPQQPTATDQRTEPSK